MQLGFSSFLILNQRVKATGNPAVGTFVLEENRSVGHRVCTASFCFQGPGNEG